MKLFNKTIITLATISTLAVAASAPAEAGWKKPFAKGLGFGVGLGVASAIFAPRQPQTVVVSQPSYIPASTCYTQTQQFYDAYGVLHVTNVPVCR